MFVCQSIIHNVVGTATMMKILIFAVVQAMIKQKVVSCTGTEIEIRKTLTFTEAYHVCDKKHQIGRAHV